MPTPVSLTTISMFESHPFDPDLHTAALRRELDGVREEVPDDLLQAGRIARHQAGARVDDDLEPHAFGIGGGPQVATAS